MPYGSKDAVMPAAFNRKRAEALLVDNPKTRIETRPGLNHLFQNAETGAMNEYVLITETLDAEVLRLMTSWLRQQAGLQD